MATLSGTLSGKYFGSCDPPPKEGLRFLSGDSFRLIGKEEVRTIRNEILRALRRRPQSRQIVLRKDSGNLSPYSPSNDFSIPIVSGRQLTARSGLDGESDLHERIN